MAAEVCPLFPSLLPFVFSALVLSVHCRVRRCFFVSSNLRVYRIPELGRLRAGGERDVEGTTLDDWWQTRSVKAYLVAAR